MNDNAMKTADDEVDTQTQAQIKEELSTVDSSLVEDKHTISLKDNKENTSDENMDQKNVLRRKQNTPPDKHKKRRKRIVVQEFSESSDEEEYSLTVSNLPTDWTYVQIKNYIDQQCGPVDEIEMLKHGDFVNCAIRLTFQSLEKCKEIMKNLQDKEVEGRKLELQMSGKFPVEEPQQNEIKLESCSDANDIIPKVSPSPPSIVYDDTWNGSPKDLYGLKPQFLKSLGIKPPLDKWVHVTNFRCDKSELRDILELAGHVLMCSVVTVAQKYAKVMYSHPLEAVQAISMLDGQMFYGQCLKVTMERNPNVFVLPKGLANIGIGLGIQGRPLRNISKQYSKYLKKHSSLINPILFTEVDAAVEFLNDAQILELEEKTNREIDKLKESTEKEKRLFKIKNVEELHSFEPKDNKINLATSKPTSLGSNSPDLAVSPNPVRNGSLRPIGPQNLNAPGTSLPVRLTHKPVQNIPQPFQPTPIQQNVPPSGFRPAPPVLTPGPFNPTQQGQFRPVQGNFVPVPGPNFGPQPMPGPFGVGPMPGPQVPMNNMGPGPMMRPNMPMQGPVRPQGTGATVYFANLPPTTTFPLLSEKVGLCGQVMSVQLTTPGCAVATFAHRAHAERCFQTYNGMNVEGYIINVKIM